MNQVIHPFQVEPLPSTTTSSRRKRSAEPQRRVCSLALVADHIFHKEVGGGDIASTVLQMLYHVREANAVFLTKVGQVPSEQLQAMFQDFHNNNKSDCIGFQVTKESS